MNRLAGIDRIVLASGNAGKVRELGALLADLGVQVLPQSTFDVPEAEETGLSFVENAILKARNAAVHTGLPAIADDSGIEVDALHGSPGIYSARYAGTDGDDAANNAKLLAALDGLAPARRRARFRSVVVFMRHATDPSPLLAEGAWDGRILDAPRGIGGFGYDPLFQPLGHTGSAAELSAAEKNRLSHRGQALRRLLAALTEA
ncbi:RdgB/HAM1 family non-canonical purine NTP pyrophosphatase [Acidihalobacter ferrooxydans]|uniref:dITP/XTP pyrophosphatase n=1 Tax=Acidihalobacter ferrooxydans TaxID=1765967 RepID=A0A1P8UJL6_9GAMM|nr:RdgB/HAM1 family non-canonical purine NTP pyrophosphatase [Acidihalobacter ferrooxydans]APZ44026.1 non-canonical purine NTP pyrophosphatase, RdgB/HAM1 family [Acidihalobacter ferrooxydans]